MAGAAMYRGILIALLCSLLACPPPTGRTRGPVADAQAMCTSATPPSPGASCERRGDRCDRAVPCGSSGRAMQMDTCECALDLSRGSMTWRCVQGLCSEAPPDAGEPICPSYPVVDGDPCGLRLGGLTCEGRVAGCDGSSVATFCNCGGSTWACRAVVCADGGGDGG